MSICTWALYATNLSPPPPLLFFLLNRMNSLSNIYPATLVFSSQFSLFLADLTQPVPLRVCNPTMHHTLTHLYIYPLFFFSNDGWTYVFCCSANVSASASISCRSGASTRYGSITEFLSVLVLFSRSFFLDEKNHKSVLAQVLTLPFLTSIPFLPPPPLLFAGFNWWGFGWTRASIGSGSSHVTNTCWHSTDRRLSGFTDGVLSGNTVHYWSLLYTCVSVEAQLHGIQIKAQIAGIVVVVYCKLAGGVLGY